MVGDVVPSLQLPLLKPEGEAIKVDKVNLHDLFKDKRTLLIGHPGAFTRFTTLKQLPEYTEALSALKLAGLDQVIFTSVNDPFVMSEYCRRTNSQFNMLADWSGQLAANFDVLLPAKDFFASVSRRYFAYVEADLRVMAVSCELDVQYTARSTPARVLEALSRLRT